MNKSTLLFNLSYPFKYIKIIISIALISFCSNLNAKTEWYNIGPGAGSDLHVLKFQPDNEDVIYVGGDIEGIFKTTDGGQSWKNINNNLAQTTYGGGIYWINDIVFDPNNSQTLYLCTGSGLFKSTNGGDYWEEIWVNIIDEEESASVSTIGINPDNPNIMFLGLGDRADGSFADFEPFPNYTDLSGLFKSTDAGKTWKEISVGNLENYSIHTILIVPNDPNQMLISSSKGIYKSTDAGETWFESMNGLPHSNCHIMKGINISGNYTLFLSLKTLGTIGNASSFSGGFFRSDDLGNNWVDITGNLPKYSEDNELFNDYWKFDINPKNPETIYLASTRGSDYDNTGIFITRNAKGNNVNWDLLYYPDLGAWLNNDWFGDPYAFDVNISPTDTNRIAMCTDGVIISNDGGYTWHQSYSISDGNTWEGTGLELMNTDCIAFHQSNPNILYIGYDDTGLFRSEDGGNTFIRLDSHEDPVIGSLEEIDGVKDIEVDPDNGDLYISRWQGSQGGHNANYSAGGIVFSSDMGNTMTSIWEGLPIGRCDLVLDKKSGSAGNRILYSAVFHHGVYKSTNSGKSWKEINNGLANDAVYAWEITIDPSDSQVLYLGMNFRGQGKKGLYESTNGGDNWTLINNFYEGDILCILVDKSGKVYVSLTDDFEWNYQGGLFVSQDGGNSWAELSTLSRIIDIDINPKNPEIIIISNQQWYKLNNENDNQGIYLSTDAGLNWENISTTMNHTFFNFARFNPYNPNFIFSGTAGGGLWVSDNLKLIDVSTEDISNITTLSINISPNPVSKKTRIKFTLKNSSFVNLAIYNNLGIKIKTLINNYLSAGVNEVEFDTNDFANGLYLCNLKTKNEMITKKLIIKK